MILKILNEFCLRVLFVLAVGAALLVSALPALAGPAGPPTRVPGPSTLVLLTVGAAAVAVAARWIRRP